MARKYVVKKIKKGLDAGKWGVWVGPNLIKACGSKSAATSDANRRNREQNG